MACVDDYTIKQLRGITILADVGDLHSGLGLFQDVNDLFLAEITVQRMNGLSKLRGIAAGEIRLIRNLITA